MDKLVHRTQPDNVELYDKQRVAQPYPKAISPHISDKAEHPQPSASQRLCPRSPGSRKACCHFRVKSKAESLSSWLQVPSCRAWLSRGCRPKQDTSRKLRKGLANFFQRPKANEMAAEAIQSREKCQQAWGTGRQTSSLPFSSGTAACLENTGLGQDLWPNRSLSTHVLFMVRYMYEEWLSSVEI